MDIRCPPNILRIFFMFFMNFIDTHINPLLLGILPNGSENKPLSTPTCWATPWTPKCEMPLDWGAFSPWSPLSEYWLKRFSNKNWWQQLSEDSAWYIGNVDSIVVSSRSLGSYGLWEQDSSKWFWEIIYGYNCKTPKRKIWKYIFLLGT